ncbi:hypothetical protein Ancab_007366, partial [Ancistrocladus abbreviatus]
AACHNPNLIPEYIQLQRLRHGQQGYIFLQERHGSTLSGCLQFGLRQRVILWLNTHNRPRTIARLYERSVAETEDCILCERARERREHLFFACAYIAAVVHKRVTGPAKEWTEQLPWIMRACGE